MPDALMIAVSLVVAYLLGSFPTGVLVTRARGVDITKVGSGNTGATNVGRALGKHWAVLVLVVDAGKGAAAVLLARALAPSPWVIAAAALTAVLGHSFSVFLRGKGGKGVATFLGAALAIAWLPTLGAAALYLIIYVALRISSVGSLAGVCAWPALLWVLGPREPAYVAFGVVTAAVIVLRHRDNLRRLARGQELKA
jgi:acyl phosphate:glycerol-3-phosphate acyltransferase